MSQGAGMDAFNSLSVMVSIALGLGLTIIPELLDGRIDVERHYFDTGPLAGITLARASFRQLELR